MRKIVALSSNNNDDYLFYLPIVVDGWFKLGYDVFLFYMGDESEPKFQYARATITRLMGESDNTFSYYKLSSIEGIDDVTVTQCSRLFASYLFKNCRIVTSDADMLVMQDIIQNESNIEVYGHDLTDRVHFPMCYVSMYSPYWRDVIGIDANQTLEHEMEKVIKAEPWHKSNVWHEKWGTDQEILYKKLRNRWYVSHDRGVDPTTSQPKGRLDRYGWRQPQDAIIDVHLPKDPLNNLDKILPLINEPILIDYCNGYKEL